MEGFLEFSDGTFFLWRSVGEVDVRVGLDSNEKGVFLRRYLGDICSLELVVVKLSREGRYQAVQ